MMQAIAGTALQLSRCLSGNLVTTWAQSEHTKVGGPERCVLHAGQAQRQSAAAEVRRTYVSCVPGG